MGLKLYIPRALPLLGLVFLVACSGSTVIPPMTRGETSSAFPSSLSRAWRTDFSKASIDFSEVLQGAPKDAIPALSNAKFISTADVDFLEDTEPVISFQIGSDVRAYPIQILIWHEIVNDVVGGRPVVVTFCPLCNTAIAFSAEIDGRTLDFGVSGFLRNSDLILFDRQTESWWQQVTGEAIVGEFTNMKLELLPSSIVSWADFKDAFPDAQVLSLDTGFSRNYGVNPYVGYDDISSSPFLFDGENDGRLAATERVVTVELGGETVAYPFSRLEQQPVVADTVGGTEIVVLFKLGTVSALDRASIAASADVGSGVVFKPIIDGQKLTFQADGADFIDNETGSRWNILGQATAGSLKGRSLEPVISANHFWFAWAAFNPDTRVWQPNSAIKTSLS